MRTHRKLLLPLLGATSLLTLAGTARADDRQLLKSSVGDPYVFLLLDTSGSMNWSSQCTAEDMQEVYDHDGDSNPELGCDDPEATPCVPVCSFLCENGDCPVPRNADDPNSKFRQAKEALHQVISEVAGGVDFGFATYNQDDLQVIMKHWLLRVDETQPAGFHTLAGGEQFPLAGSEQVFGPLLPRMTGFGDEAPQATNAWGCDRNGGGNQVFTGSGASQRNDEEEACYPSDAALVTDQWAIEKTRRLPKLGADWNTTVVEFIRSGTTTYRVTYRPAVAPNTTNGRLEIELDVELQPCNSGFSNTAANCNPNGAPTTLRIVYWAPGWAEAGFVFWDNSVNRADQSGNSFNVQRGYVGYTASRANHTCRGWDPSAEPGTGAYLDSDGDVDLSNIDRDPFASYNLKVPTRTQADGPDVFDPSGPLVSNPNVDWRFWRGDVLPLSWTDDNVGEILARLTGAASASAPEAFGQAYHLRDQQNVGENYLRLNRLTPTSVASPPPMIATGSTPLAGMATFFRHWYSNCGDPGADCDIEGWQAIAAQYDPDWNCRKKFIIFLTDGDETCDGRNSYYSNNGSRFPPGFNATADVCRYVQVMKQARREDITTVTIAFGVQEPLTGKLQCLSQDGQLYTVRNKGELVEKLRELFGQFKEASAAFASAAVPSVQANVADKIYLSSFTPLNGESVWPGRLDAFLKPLPLDADGLPDRVTRICDPGTIDANCFAWDAGDSQTAWSSDPSGYNPRGLLLQAPFASEITRGDNSTLRIGTGNDERRVYFGTPSSTVAGKRQYFRYPGDAAETAEFVFAWDDPADPLPSDPVDPSVRADAIADIIEFTLMEKRGSVDVLNTPTDPSDDQRIQYLMGDVFHANPVVISPPADFDLYTKDLYWNRPLCGASLESTRARGNQISYSWFSNKHLCRRQMLFVASDDGQLHAFDAGIFRGTSGDSECKLDLPDALDLRDPTLGDSTPINGKFDIGSGREIFSFIPGGMMDHVRDLSEISELTTEYGIDNTVRVADVFIDPVRDISGAAACDEREWRTVLLGSYREGGPGLFALDITQPDRIDTGTNMPQPLAGSPAYVPSCADGGVGCGPNPFPALLWEFTDTEAASATPLDEDGNGLPDLAEGWSRPGIARIQVCNGECDSDAEPEDRFVAIFGGGLPESPANSVDEPSGNWLYMVDVETGQTLYKRGGMGVIDGAVAADVTLVDVDVDGLVDTLYFGTTAGFLYKLDLGEGPFELGGDGRIQDPTGDTGRYNPFKAFDTERRPIYMEANAVYVTKLRKNALLFGTGNRWNLWEFNGLEGRFYAIVDTGWVDANRDGVVDQVCPTCASPLREASLQQIDPDSAFDIENPGPNYLFGNPDNPDLLAGWYFPFGANEKVITEPFTISGVSFFSVYDPVNVEIDGACARGGESKLFIVNAASAVGYTPTETGYARYRTTSAFTTQPFAESSATQNRGAVGGNADTWTDALRQINRELRELQPPTCRFANYTIDIKTIRSDTRLEFIAPVPVCIEGHNWKEY